MAATTIIVIGFPTDVRSRELTNLCRFASEGYEDSHVVKGGTLFVKFETTGHANAAIAAINGSSFDPDDPRSVLKADFAKRELEPRRNSESSSHPRATPATDKTPRPVGFSAQKIYEAPDASKEVMTTLAVLGAKDKGFRQDELESWFRSQRGFQVLQVNDRIDGTFVKFASRAAAESALQEANHMQMRVEWARRNLEWSEAPPERQDHGDSGKRKRGRDRDRDHGADWSTQSGDAWSAGDDWSAGPGWSPMMMAMNAASCNGGDWTEQSGQRQQNNELNTITVLGLKGKGLRQEEVEQWFQQCPGFVTCQTSKRTDGLFIKFSSQFFADQALNSANIMSFGAEWARRNLEEDSQAATSAHQGWTDAMPAVGWTDVMQAYMATAATAMGGAGEIDTIAVFGNGVSKDKVHQWFYEQPGFVTLQVNKKLDGTFGKFISPAHAEQAINDAPRANIKAEWARRNLEA